MVDNIPQRNNSDAEVTPVQTTQYTQLQDLDIEQWNVQHKEISLTLRTMIRILVITCIFCLITVSGAPDIALLTNGYDIPLPFGAGQIPFIGFLIAGPFLIIGLLVYSHIFLGMHHTLESNLPNRGKGNLYRPPFIINSGGIFSRVACFFIFYLLVPITILVFCARTTSGNPLHHYIANTIGSFLLVSLMFTHFKRNRKQKNKRNFIASQAFITLLLFPICLLVFNDPTLQLRSSYFGPKVWAVNIGLDKGKQLNLQNADLQQLKLLGSNFSMVDISNANFAEANLAGATFYNTILTEADLSDTNLKHAYLEQVDLSRANLSRANFNDAELSDVDFSKAKIFDTDLKDAIIYNVKNLSCEELKRAENWESSFRSRDLACDAPIPEMTDDPRFTKYKLEKFMTLIDDAIKVMSGITNASP